MNDHALGHDRDPGRASNRMADREIGDRRTPDNPTPLPITLIGSQDRRVLTNGVNTHTRMLTDHLPEAGVRVALEIFPSEQPGARRALLATRVAGRLMDRDRDARALRDLTGRYGILLSEAKRSVDRIRATACVHAQDYVAAAAITEALGNDRPPLVLAYHVNGRPDAELQTRFDLPDTSRAVTWVRRTIAAAIRSATAIVPVSAWAEAAVRDLLHGTGPAPLVEVIPNGIRIPSLDGVPALPGRAPVAVSLGQLVPRKGYDVLCEATRILMDGPPFPPPRVAVRVAGSGPLRDSLTREALRLGVPVEFPGSVDGVDAFLATARAFVLPSREDNLPMALLEAMAAGLPVVASSVGGIPDAVGQGEDAGGTLVPPGDARALADALRAYLVDGDLAATVGARARARAERTHSASRMAERYAALYRTLALSRP